MEFLNSFKDIAPFLQHPLVLVGFAILLFFGILAVLIKAGILPALPRRIAGEVVKRVINYGFIIAVLVIVLGFWEHFQEQRSDEHTGKDKTSNAGTSSVKPDSSEMMHQVSNNTNAVHTKAYCRVILLLPSDLNDAEILVDGKLADIIERKLTSITLRMERREVSQKIVVRNSFRECTTRILVDGNKELQPCL